MSHRALLVMAALCGAAILRAVPASDQAVRVDAIVTDARSRPIRDLAPSDFEIVDAGEARPADSAVFQSGESGRLVAIFFDEYHVQPASAARAKAALRQFIDTDVRDADLVAIIKPLDPLNTIQLKQDRVGLAAIIAALEGRKGDYAPRTDFESSFMSRAPAAADANRTQVVSSALQTLAMRIGAAREGRKSIVLVSEGFTTAMSRGSDRLTGTMRAIVYTANRYGVAIYPVNPDADDTKAPDIGTATLQALADETGGVATLDHGDIAEALHRSIAELDQYYMLTYQAATTGDGKFHQIQVRVKRPGSVVRIRSGYWAANAELVRLATNGPSRPSVFVTRPPHTSPFVKQWVGTSKGPDGLTSVTLAWEPSTTPPAMQDLSSVTLTATGEDGRVLFEDRVDEQARFNAPPGRLQLELTLRGADGKTLDVDYRVMTVPSLSVSRPTIATPVIIRTRSARQFAAATKSLDATPAIAREFSRTERLIVRVPAYAGGGSTPVVSATLLNRLGNPMRTLSTVAADLSPDMAQFDLPLSSLAPEDYRLELVASGSGGPDAKMVITFRVTN
jgi:VWFA-related protein